jgi:hypothetical protein
MLHDGTVVIVHSDNVTSVDLVGLLEFPLESPQAPAKNLSKSGFVHLEATRKYHSP